MSGRVGRWTQSAVLTIWIALLTMAALPARPASAAGTDIVWKTDQLPWAAKTTTALTGAARDTQYVTSSADSLRTDFVSTAAWAFDAMNGIGAAAGPINIAYLTLTVSGADNGASDTVYVTYEKRVKGVVNKNNTLVTTLGCTLVLQGQSTGPKAVFRGPIQFDGDGSELLNQVGPGDDFRLVVHGDQSGTTPKLSQCRLWVTYPARRASTP